MTDAKTDWYPGEPDFPAKLNTLGQRVNERYLKPADGIPGSDIKVDGAGGEGVFVTYAADGSFGAAVPVGGGGGGSGALTYEINVDYTNKSSMPTLADSGQALIRTWNTTSAANPDVSANRLIIPTTVSGAQAGYVTAQAGGTITYLEGDFQWTSTGTTAGQNFTLVAFTNAMPSGALTGLVGTQATSCHVAFVPGGWAVSTATNIFGAGLAVRGSRTYTTPITDSRVQHVSARIDKATSTMYITGADNVTVAVTHPDVALTATYATHEIYYNAANTDARVQVLGFAATSAAGGLPTGGTSGGSGGASLASPILQSLLQAPDPQLVESTINPIGATLTFSNASASTSIAGGITALDMSGGTAALTGKASVLGTQTSQLEAIAAGYYGCTWNQSFSNGQWNYESAGPNTPWGLQFWTSAGTQMVEILGGLGAIGGFVAYVDGRKMQLDSTPSTGSSSLNNKFKIDFGSGNTGPHHVRVLFHWTFSFAKIFVSGGGAIYAAPPSGLKVGLISDSSGNVDTVTPSDHLDFWFTRFANMAGFQDVYQEPLGGRGMGVPFSNYSSFISTATNSPIKSQGLDILFVGTAFGNDKLQGRTVSQVQNDMATFLSVVGAWAKVPKVVFYGFWDPAGGNGSGWTDYDAACVARAAAAGAAYISLATGNVYGFGGTAPIATMGPLITTTNKAALIFTDNLHPTLAGQVQLSRYIYQAWKIILKAAAV